MSTDTVIVTISVVGQPEVVDVEIPDNRSCYEVITQVIHALGWVNTRDCRVECIEVVEPYSMNTRVIKNITQTVLAADIRDGSWILVRLAQNDDRSIIKSMDIKMAPTAEHQSSVNISFQKRRVLHGKSVTRDD